MIKRSILGLARGSVFHAVQDALHHALGKHMGDAQLDRAVCIDAAGHRLVAGRNAHRHRLARDRRGVQTAFALGHFTVERHAVARADKHNVAHCRVLGRDGAGGTVRRDQLDGFRPQVDRGHDLAARTLDRAVLEELAHAVEQHNANRLIERADRPCADRGERHQEVFVEYTALADVFDRGQQHAPAEQQVGRQHDDDLGDAAQDKLAQDEQACADQNFGERVAVGLLLLFLGRDDLGFALDRGADLADLRKQRVRIVAGYAQLAGFIDQHAVVHAVQLADLILHFRRTVRTAQVLYGVNALVAAALGRGRDDLGLAFDRGTDFADAGQQGVRIFTSHAQLLGFKDQHAVLDAVQLADLVLHFGCAVRAAHILQGVDALDAVRTRLMVVLVTVVMVVMAAAAVVAVVVMMLVVVVVMAAAAVVAVVVMMLVVVMVMAAAAVVAVVVMMLVVMVVVTAAAFITVVVMMLVVVVVMAAAAVVAVVVMMLVVVVVMATAAVVAVVVMMLMMRLGFAMMVVNMF